MDGFPDMSKHIEAEKKRLILLPGDPLQSARIFLKIRCHSPDGQTLHHQNGTFYRWQQTHYIELTNEEIRAELYKFLEEADQPSEEKGETEPFRPNKSKVENVREALAAAAQLRSTFKAPAWLDDDGTRPHAKDIVSCANGLLHLPTRELFPHCSAFFTLNALDFPYARDAAEPTEWLKFMNQLWPGDPQSVEMLQEVFGLTLTGDTSFQKAFLLVGPPRCGKGTIARVQTKLLGQPNVCGPTLSSLGQNFGLAPLLGKRLAIISDARLGGKTDQQIVVERILSITGEDSLSVPRKFRDDWTGQLETRIVILTNELPRLSDSSGALASRFEILLFKQSFLGREDRGLTHRLILELGGILNWSLDGWDRLKARGYFVQPASANEAQKDFHDLGSPMRAFIRDCCILGPTASCKPEIVYNRWLDWCNEQHIMTPGTVQTFGRDLRSVVPGLATTKPLNEQSGKQERQYQGLGVLPRDP